jgi:putative thioredoxin
MTTPSSRPDATPSMNLHGAVDLSGLKKSNSGTGAAAPGAQNGTGVPAGGAGAAGQAASTSGSRFILNVTEESFGQIVQLSSQVPVVVELGSSRSDASAQLSPVLEKLAVEYNGRILLARVDADASAQIAQAFQVQSVPAVVAVLKGQPVPLFEGAQPEEHVRSFLQELLKVAEANGVTGTLDGDESAAGDEEEKPLPPLHQEAYDAIEAGDYAAASESYRKALAEQPADAEAKAGLAQVELMQRVQDMDGNKVRQEAADAPDSVPAQLAVADLDVVGGHVEDAFSRLVKLVGRTAGDDRESARARLVELFDVVGTSDPRVSKARSALARALF